QPPFRGDTPLQTLEQVVGREPLSPRRLDARVPRELETICLKCLEKEPGKRYAGARELADDLGNWLEDRPIQARRPTPWQRLRKWPAPPPPVTTWATPTTAWGRSFAGWAGTARRRTSCGRQFPSSRS